MRKAGDPCAVTPATKISKLRGWPAGQGGGKAGTRRDFARASAEDGAGRGIFVGGFWGSYQTAPQGSLTSSGCSGEQGIEN